MTEIRITRFLAAWFLGFGPGIAAPVFGGQPWRIPLAGNAYRTSPDPNHRAIGRDEVLRCGDPDETFSIFFHVASPARLTLALQARAGQPGTQLRVTVAGQAFVTPVDGDRFATHPAGTVDIEHPGYVRVDLQLVGHGGDTTWAEIKELVVRSDSEDLDVTYVATDEGNLFYWGRRGPSVHLSYVVPDDVDLEYAYSEITVAEGDDPVGSYFMANGFAEGYFGIQVNSERERRVLFSIWSPFRTDDPRQIPAEQRVELLARGPEVNTGEFGNEGSGGQSYLVYPWRAGRTYRFLTRVVPDGQGNTVYTSWFGDKQADTWRWIASFRRPQTDTHLRRFHSFLENFDPRTGHLGRRGRHENVWVRDTEGNWHPCLEARFSVDATGRGGHRLDFAGGTEGSAFYLRNCGFFDASVAPGTLFTRASPARDRPAVDIGQLPGPD